MRVRPEIGPEGTEGLLGGWLYAIVTFRAPDQGEGPPLLSVALALT
jgi:hypothetical protein